MRNLAQMSCDLNIAVDFVQCEQASELFMSPYNGPRETDQPRKPLHTFFHEEREWNFYCLKAMVLTA